MKKSRILIVLLSLVMVLAACGKKEAPANGNANKEQAATSEEKGKEDGVLDICIASEPSSIDPALNTASDGAIMINHLFEGLIKWDNDGKGNAKLAPGQAESWDVSEDGLEWTFHLRDGIKWSDGKPVTAQDFVYAWNRLVAPETGADYEYMIDMVKGYEEKKLAVEAPDDKTFVVHLNVAVPYFDEICAFPATFPVREDIVSDETWTTKPETMITNGAYKMVSWEHNQVINLEKNSEYYDADKMTAEKLAFHLKDDHNAIYASYRSGELDFINSLPNEEIPKLLDSGELKTRPKVGTYFVCFNTEKAPFDDAKVRKAFSLVIDRNFIVNQVTGEGQVPATGFVPAGVYDAKGPEGDDFRTTGGEYYSVKDEDYAKNIEEAKKLMEEAGYKDGAGFPTIEYLYNTSEGHKAIAEALQNMWQENLGVQVSLQNEEWNVFLNDRKKGNFEISRHGWIADYNDPMSFIDMWMTGGGNNDCQYKNPEFDAKVKEAKATADQEVRMKAMHSAEDIMMNDMILSPLYFYTEKYMMKPNIDGLYYTPLGYFFFGETKGF